MADWTDASHADGPMLAAWLRSYGLPPRQRNNRDAEALYHVLYRWERGARAGFATVDRWATFLGLHVSELPGEVWVHNDNDPPGKRAEVGGSAASDGTFTDVDRPQNLATRSAGAARR